MKGIIFDLDGTLIDSLPGLTWALNLMMEQWNLKPFSLEETSVLVGNGMKQLVKKALIIRGRQDIPVEDSFQAMKNYYSKCWNQDVAPYEGIPQLLSNLQEKGIPFAVNTNKEHRAAEIMLQHYFPKFWPFPLAGRSDLRPQKPDPSGAFFLAEQMGVPSQDCFYVGDMEVDLQTAVNGGIKSCAVTWGFRRRKQLEPFNPDYCAEEPQEVWGIIENCMFQ
ncbi:MAG: HAD family hydrolase [Spirochaetaceae bacterium]|nr:HAD family hydrolase [Spirochaetaceae bacterium]